MRLIQSTILCTLFLAAAQMPAFADVKVENSITVNAKTEAVWQALMQYQREEKTFHKKLVASHDDAVSIKEEFVRMPVVGTAYIDYDEVSHRDENRIDYKLTESKVLTKFEGSWRIEPCKTDSNSVTLTLTTDIDSWMPIPFKNKILRNATKKGMDKRLAFVKDSAEKKYLSASR